MWSHSALALVLLVGAVSCAPPQQGRVVDGTATDITKYPFMVSLRGPTGSHSCGSSILDSKWILTAAHCVSGRKAEQLSIQYGTTQIGASGPNIANVKRIIIHEGYNPSASYANDIALIELTGELFFNSRISPVTLPEPYFEVPQVQTGAPGVLTGWGLNATGGVIMQILQEVDLKIYSDEECNARHNGRTTGDHICGGVDAGGKGQCSGDSGGPLLLDNSVQLGIVSWSQKPCTVAPYPGVYTKVSHYIDWIKANKA